MIVTLPWPPTINHYYGNGRNGRRFIKPAGKKFRADVCAILLAAGVKPIEGDVSLMIWVWPPDKRKRDMDNLNKAIWDALQHGGAYHNDCQIAEFGMRRMKVMKGGKVTVRIMEMVDTISTLWKAV